MVLTLGPRARAAAARISPSVWRILAHSMLFGLAASIADLLFNFYVVSLGYANDAAGLLSTVYRTAGVLVGLPVGALIDRVGPRRSLIAGVLLFGLSWAGVITSSSLPLLLACYFCAGAANILTLTAVVPLLTGFTSGEERATVFGMNASAALVIGLVGSSLGGVLPGLMSGLVQAGPQDTLSYRVALGSVVALGLAAALPVLRLGERAQVLPGAGAAGAEVEPAHRSWRSLVLIAVPSLTLGVAGGLFLPFQNLFFRQVFQLGDAAVGAALAAGALAMGIGALIGAPLSARLGVRRAAWVLRLGAAPAMLLMTVPLIGPALAGYLLRGAFVAASFPLNDTLVMQTTPARQRGTASSLMSVMWSLGWAAAAAVSGWLQVRYGFGPLIVISAVAYAASTATLALLPRG